MKFSNPEWTSLPCRPWLARAAETVGKRKIFYFRKIFQAGNLGLDINPDLVIVEGLEFAGTIEEARERPIQLSRQVLKIFHCKKYLISENISEPAGLLWSHVSLLVGLDPPLPRVQSESDCQADICTGVWPTDLCWILDGGVRHRQTKALETTDLQLTRS